MFLTHDVYRCLSIEIDDVELESLIQYYTTGADFPISYTLAGIDRDCNGFCINALVDQWADIPDTKSIVWAVRILLNKL